MNGLENMFLSDVMDDHLVAARVFGSSDNPGCNLTSVIHPLEPFKPYKALISLEDLIPGTRGMSAIGRALTSAYHDLKDHSGPKSIFLITDGGDSCGNAKYINDLRDVLSGNAKYKDFSIDVFGFNLDSKFMDLYKDFAQKTGGDFYPFGTFIELSSYLEDLSNVHLNGGQLEIVSENENGERFLVLDSYNSPVAYGSVGKPVRVLEGTYSIQIPNS